MQEGACRDDHGVTIVLYSRRRWLWLLKGEKTLAELAQLHDVHTTQIAAWKAQLLEGAPGVFDGGSSARPSAPGPDLKTLHAKIGELALENDFLSAALGKAGLPSAKR